MTLPLIRFNAIARRPTARDSPKGAMRRVCIIKVERERKRKREREREREREPGNQAKTLIFIVLYLSVTGSPLFSPPYYLTPSPFQRFYFLQRAARSANQPDLALLISSVRVAPWKIRSSHGTATCRGERNEILQRDRWRRVTNLNGSDW